MASNSEQQLASFTVLSFESLLPSSFLHVTAAILVFGSLLCLYVWPRLPGQRLQILSSVLLELEHAVAYSLLPNSYFQVEVTVSLTRCVHSLSLSAATPRFQNQTKCIDVSD